MRKDALLASSFIILIILGGIPVIAETETETETRSTYQTTTTSFQTTTTTYQTATSTYQTTTATDQQQGSSLQFRIVPVPVASAPNYPGGSGSASIMVQGTVLSIHLQVEGAAHRAHFTLLLSVNNSTQSVASMTTDEEGEIEAQAQATLGAGNYSLGLRILDASSFGSPTLVMTTSPASGQLLVSGSSQTSFTQSETEGQQVNTVGGSESDDTGVRNAIQSMVIPAVVDVGAAGSSAVTVDNRFSISVGSLQNDGIIVSVSAANVTGSRVILVNLTAPAAQKLFSESVLVTLDGASIQQGSSVSQVLAAGPGDPSRFVIYSSGSGVKLLVSIPHFSFHTIQILPILAEVGSALLDLSTVILSVAAVSAIIVVAYARRTRFVG